MRLSPFARIDNWFAPPPSAQTASWLRGQPFAHRGLHDAVQGGTVVENSTGAFLDAMEAGFGIECDVQRTDDGQAVVFHDFTLDRLTHEKGAVAAHTLEALTAMRLRAGKGAGKGDGLGETIPSLRQLLKNLAGRAPLLLEVKSKADRRVTPLCLSVRQALEGYIGPVAVMSFDPRVGAWFARNAPQITRGLVMTEEGAKNFTAAIRRHQALWIARPQFLAYDVRDLPSSFAAKQRARGLPLLTWTVRSPDLLAIARAHADAPIFEGTGRP